MDDKTYLYFRGRHPNDPMSVAQGPRDERIHHQPSGNAARDGYTLVNKRASRPSGFSIGEPCCDSDCDED